MGILQKYPWIMKYRDACHEDLDFALVDKKSNLTSKNRRPGATV